MLPSQRNETKPRGGVLLWLAEGLIALYVILDAIIAPLFRPLASLLMRLRVVLRLERLVAGLPPYVILVLLLIPFFIADPAKVYGLYLMGTGHLLRGACILVAAYVVSVVLVEQVYQAGKTKLRRLPWFAQLTDWMFDVRDRLLNWFETTPAWGAVMRVDRQVRDMMLRWRLRCVAWLASRRS